MGQIKNIKLHIVTDIKLNAWTLTLPKVNDATTCKLQLITQPHIHIMNGHSDTEEGMVNGVDSKDALSNVLGTPKPMSALPRIPKKKKEGGEEITSPKKEVKKEEPDDEDFPMSNGNGQDSPDEKVKIKEEEMDSEEEEKHKSKKRKHDDDDENDEEYKKA